MEDYWNNFYQKNFKFTNKNSSFSEWCLYQIKNISNVRLVDIGCGNGRDLIFFENNNINCFGIDSSIESIQRLKKTNENVEISSSLNFDYKDFNVLYCRFLIHTMKKSELELFLKNLSEKSTENSILFIETRISENQQDYKKNFNSGIGKNHVRYLYSEETIVNLLSENDFILERKIKSYGLSKFENEDPLILRIKSINKKTTL